MQFTGKKTQRLWLPTQICEDEQKAAAIKNQAARADRKLQDHIRRLLTLGMRCEEEILNKEQKITFSREE
jgi:hypothetical protein